MRPPKEIPAGTPEAEVFRLHLDHWISEFFRGRVIVKRRASFVTIATTGITGAIAVVGGVMALLASDNLPVQILGVTTTGLAALSAVLLAWNDHFHHRDLWMLRSVVLNRLEELQLDYQSNREGTSIDYADLRSRLDLILKDALNEWLRVQGNRAL